MREVGVHLDHSLGARIQRVGETREIRRAEAGLPRSVQHLDPFALGRQAVGDRAGAVRRGVVDHQHVGARQGGEHAAHDGLESGRLVVGGKDDPDGRRHGGP